MTDMIKWIKETDTWEHIQTTPEEAAIYLERLRFEATCNEASALADEYMRLLSIPSRR